MAPTRRRRTAAGPARRRPPDSGRASPRHPAFPFPHDAI